MAEIINNNQLVLFDDLRSVIQKEKNKEDDFVMDVIDSLFRKDIDSEDLEPDNLPF